LTVKYRFLIADGPMPALDLIEKSAAEFSPGLTPALTHQSTVVPAEQPAPKAQEKKPAKPQAAATEPATRRAQKKTNRPGPVDAPLVFNLPPPEPLKGDTALKSFVLPAGYRIEPVATEPMVETPIAISFDQRGRMFVVEMRSYMLDVENEREMDPIGRIKLLEDTDNDGRMDKASVFVDGLVMPRAVLAIRGGALVAEPPTLSFYEDTNGDGVADKKTVVASDYGVKGGQPEHMANTPMVAIDNWIYSAVYPQRFRFTRGKWVAEPTRTRGQYGLAQDDYGRFFFSTNSDVARGMPLPSSYFDRNPFYKARAATDVGLMTTQEVWPSHPTPGVNRGYEKDQLRPDGTLATATGAGGSAIYRGDLMPELYGNLFTPEPCGNLMKRMVVTDSAGKLAATNAYPDKDFLTSTDERFRPVFATTGPDGALYVVDMYQGVLQHYYFLTHYLIKNIKARNLESPVNWGRIYRIVPEGKSAQAMKMPEKAADLVGLLAHANGWVRDTAQRMLVEKNDKSVVPTLKKMALGSPSALGRLHALWTLEGMGRLDQPTTVKALADKDAKVRAAAIRLSEPLLAPTTRQQFQPTLLKLAGDPSADVQLQLALTLGAFHETEVQEMVANFLTRSAADDEIMRDAVLSGLRGRELEFTEYLLTREDWAKESPSQKETLTALARCVINERRANRIGRMVEIAATELAGSWRQSALLEGLAPPADPKTKPSTAPTGKLVYLDEAPKGLDALLSAEDTSIRDVAARMNSRLAWPGKAGVPPPPVVRPLTSQEEARFDHGKMVYTQICATCHQSSGYGLEGTAPPLVDSEWVLGSPARNVRIVLQGLTGPITINGGAFKGEMPALPTLSDEDIAAVLTYIRREWDHDADPIDEPTVAKIREETKTRGDLWTAKELQEIK
jgi:mono/diheme cytochrome c family protein/glucose/arabinose dehydrogenase